MSKPTGTVCGLAYTAAKGHTPYSYGRRIQYRDPLGHLPRREPITKYFVTGVNHRNGKPIAFRSLERAERHIRNMGLAND